MAKKSKLRNGEKATMLLRKQTFTIPANNGKTGFIHKCCECGLEHDVDIEVKDKEADVTFTQL